MADPAVTAGRLTGLDVLAVTDDASPRGQVALALWEPPFTSYTGENGAPVRRAASSEAADLLADLVVEDVRTLAFVRSRRGAEQVAMTAAEHLAEVDPSLPARVAAYRGGYLPEERRDDRGGAAQRRADRARRHQRARARHRHQRAGRRPAGRLPRHPRRAVAAGRPGRPRRPGRPGDPGRPRRPARHLPGQPPRGAVRAAGRGDRLRPDQPLRPRPPPVRRRARVAAGRGRPGDVRADGARAVVDELTRAGLLRRRPRGWFWTDRRRASDLADIRSTGGAPVQLVEAGTGRVIGTVDAASAHGTAHRGAVYVHRGETWLVRVARPRGARRGDRAARTPTTPPPPARSPTSRSSGSASTGRGASAGCRSARST